MTVPDQSMLVPLEKIMRFMETRDDRHLAGAFAANATFLDSFTPFVFQGADAVTVWAQAFVVHAENLTELKHHFHQAQEFSRHNHTVYFSQPVSWNGFANGKPFEEKGGLAVMLVEDGKDWFIKNYAWAVTDFSMP